MSDNLMADALAVFRDFIKTKRYNFILLERNIYKYKKKKKKKKRIIIN